MTAAQPAPSPRVETGQEGGVVTLTLKNPPVNALGPPVVRDLAAAFDHIEKDAGARVVVITGAGRFFSAGADVGEMARSPYEQVAEYVRTGRALFDRIASFPKPVIAAVNGFALGGGCELALACDLCVMAESARLGLPEINLGVLPGWGGIQRLARAVGKGRALEVVLTGRMIEPREAHALGLAAQVTPDAELSSAAKTLAQQLAGKAPLAVREIKARVATGLGVPVNEAVLGDLEAFLRILRSQDAKEGMAAFLEKRQPNFQGK